MCSRLTLVGQRVKLVARLVKPAGFASVDEEGGRGQACARKFSDEALVPSIHTHPPAHRGRNVIEDGRRTYRFQLQRRPVSVER